MHINEQINDNRYPQYILDQIKKGTTTCAITCTDGVVLLPTLEQVQVFS